MDWRLARRRCYQWQFSHMKGQRKKREISSYYHSLESEKHTRLFSCMCEAATDSRECSPELSEMPLQRFWEEAQRERVSEKKVMVSRISSALTEHCQLIWEGMRQTQNVNRRCGRWKKRGGALLAVALPSSHNERTNESERVIHSANSRSTRTAIRGWTRVQSVWLVLQSSVDSFRSNPSGFLNFIVELKYKWEMLRSPNGELSKFTNE